ncbi:hypothetical protein GOP47_0026766 [Adiantum capillus-veneris]|nr:hypothetical protein GOP47_0026766 [Adiantum capillus-veneris]
MLSLPKCPLWVVHLFHGPNAVVQVSPSTDNLHQQHAEAVYITLFINDTLLQPIWSKVSWGASHHRHHVCFTLIYKPRQTKICYLCFETFVEKDILRLDV